MKFRILSLPSTLLIVLLFASCANDEASNEDQQQLSPTSSTLEKTTCPALTKALADPEHTLTLDLSGQYLTALTPEIGKLKNLQELNLSNNKLTSLPAEFANLKQLKWLDAGQNQLSGFPFTKTQLPALRYLNVFQNNLTESALTAIKKRLPGVAVKNEDCVFNNDYEGLTYEMILKDHPEFKNHTWDADDLKAVVPYGQKDTLRFSIGGCVHFNFHAEWTIMDDTTSLNNLDYWIAKAKWLASRSDDFFERAIIDKRYEQDKELSKANHIFILAKEKEEGEGEYIEPFIELLRNGNTTVVTLSWYQI